jgi:hypothetical protein
LCKEVLAIPTRSPRGLLIKVAIGIEAPTVEGIENALNDCDWAAETLLPPLLVDLRAMATA